MNSKKVPGKRMERKKEETRSSIISIAMTLFKEKGVDGTTMEEIAEKADIAKGTLYNYFPVKEAIIDEYIKRSFTVKNEERILQMKNLPDTRARLLMIFNELISGVKGQKEIFEKYLVYRMKILLSFHQEDSEKSGFYLIANEIIKLGREEGEIRKDLPLYVMVELFEFAFIEIVKLFYREKDKFDVSADIEPFVDLCINGIRHNPQSNC